MEKERTLQKSRKKLQNLVNLLDEILAGNISQSEAARRLEMNRKQWEYNVRKEFLPFLRGLEPMPEYEVQEVLDGLHSPYENLVYDILGYSGVIKERNVLVLTIAEEEKIQKAMESMLSDRQQDILNCLYGITGEKKTQKETAKELGLSESTVRTEQVHSLRILRDPEFLRSFFQEYRLYIKRMEETAVLRTLNQDFQERLAVAEEKWKAMKPARDHLERPLALYQEQIPRKAWEVFKEYGLVTVRDVMEMDSERFRKSTKAVPELLKAFRVLQIPLSPEEFGDSPLLDQDISILHLSVRSSNGLCRAGIQTIGDLLSYTPEEISKIRNLGSKSIHEIKEKVEKLGLTEIWKENSRE